MVSNSKDERHQAASSLQEPVQDESEARQGDDGNNDDDDENETCGFCIFMKGGGCRQAFNVRWLEVMVTCKSLRQLRNNFCRGFHIAPQSHSFNVVTADMEQVC